jgi:outer membrane protein assembly factor BamB
VGNRVLVGSSDGRLYSLDRKTGKELWRFDAGGGLIAAPAVAGGYLVIGNDDGQLYCFGAEGGG